MPGACDPAGKNVPTVLATQSSRQLKNNTTLKVSAQLKEGESYQWKTTSANLVKSKLTLKFL